MTTGAAAQSRCASDVCEVDANNAAASGKSDPNGCNECRGWQCWCGCFYPFCEGGWRPTEAMSVNNSHDDHVSMPREALTVILKLAELLETAHGVPRSVLGNSSNSASKAVLNSGEVWNAREENKNQCGSHSELEAKPGRSHHEQRRHKLNDGGSWQHRSTQDAYERRWECLADKDHTYDEEEGRMAAARHRQRLADAAARPLPATGKSFWQ